MSIIDTLIQEAAERREHHIQQLPVIAARRCDAYVPDGESLRACASQIEVAPCFDACDHAPEGTVRYHLPYGLVIEVSVDGQEDSDKDVSVLNARRCSIAIDRKEIGIALYRGKLASMPAG